MDNSAAIIDSLLARVDELESRIAIRDLASDYCHGFDKRDYPRFLNIWWPDCRWNIGPPFGEFEGHAGIEEAIYSVLWPAWRETHHLSTNQVITFSDADNAESVCDVDCVGTLTDNDECQIVGATYADSVQRRDGVWKILVRNVDIHYFNPVTGTRLAAPTAD